MKVLNDICLELHVPDMEQTINFYSKLGFEIVWQQGEGLQLAVLRRGGSLLKFYGGNKNIFQQSYFKRFSPDTPRGYAVEITIPVEDPKQLYDLICLELSTHIVSELQIRWGRLEFRLIDPFGFYLRIVEDYDWVTDPGEMLNSSQSL